MARITRRTLLGSAAAATAVTSFNILTWPADAAEFSYKYGNNQPDTHPLSTHAKAAADRIREETGGRLDIAQFPGNQLGNDTEMLQQLRSGALEFQKLSPLILGTYVPLASINGVAFAFKDYDAVWGAMDGDLGALVRAAIDKAGIHAFDRIWDNGYRQITSSTHPIAVPDDLKGFKIRVPVSPLWTSLFKGFGAAPAGINFSEVYSALQTHIVEGQENPLVTINASKLYEVQKYCSMTSHMWDGYWMLANQEAWARLPPDIQEIVVRNFTKGALDNRSDTAKLNAGLADEMKGKGLVFNTPDPAPFRKALSDAGFYAEWKGKFGADAWAVLEKYTGPLV
ncbi:MAG TPA: TRAP transporter substrate-binding protein [Aliidongia sp.]|nr:TRAP transporter substrate-binding protein [Aliidongia sp.]